MARASTILLAGFTVLSLALLLFTALQQAQGASTISSSSERQEQPAYVPVRSVVYRSRLSASTTAAEEEDAAAVGYEPFEVCDGCRCCSASDPGSCVDTTCCYAIDCNLPGKPFGTCAFTPQTCGCGDSNCTQPA